MQRDVAAIVDIGTRQRCGRRHDADDFFSDGAGHRGHWRDEYVLRERRHSCRHAARHGSDGHCARAVKRRPQQYEFLTEFGQKAVEALLCSSVGSVHCRIVTESLHDEIDRAVLQHEPLPVG